MRGDKIGIIGAGYVGLTTGICLASMKHEISIFDLNKEKIKQISDKKLPFFEQGLQEILENTITSKNLVPVKDLIVDMYIYFSIFFCLIK